MELPPFREESRMKTVLLTSHSLDERYGTELYVAGLAGELLSRGWRVGAHSLVLGTVAEQMRESGIAVSNRVEDLPRPDVIHGNSYFETLLAHLTYPDVPIFSLLHVDGWWLQFPPFVAALRRVGAVSDDCREAAVGQLGFEESAVGWFPNFADPERFRPRDPLPENPRRALIFSNYASDETFVPAIRLACQELNISVDTAGARSGRVTAEPERLLPRYDLVFAKGRAAIEAMVAGCAVVVCDFPGAGPMVREENLEALRRLNFGHRTMTRRLNPQQIIREVTHYDPEDAARVSQRMRDEASLGPAVDLLESTYEELIEGWPVSAPLDRPHWTEQLEALVAAETECNESPIFASAMVALAKKLDRDRS